MIEFKAINSNTDEEIRRSNFDIYIDGKHFSPPDFVGRMRDDGSIHDLILRSADLIEQFISHKVIEIPVSFEYLNISFRPNYAFGLKFLDSVSISEKYEKKYNSTESKSDYEFVSLGTYDISYNFDPDLTEWNQIYSITDYYEFYSKALTKLGDSSIKFGKHDPQEGLQHGFFVRFQEFPLDLPLEEVIKNNLTILRRLHSEVESAVLANQNQNSVAISIEIPDEIREPYSQYLIYFSRFLKDLGVNASSELHNEAGNILFTITPVDENEALDKIRAALEVYLRLPNSPIDEYSNISTEIEVQRLTANVQHLKSQLSLANAQKQLNEAVIEAKDVTIQALRFTVSQQKQLLSGDISTGIIDITPHNPNTQKDKEDLINGIVSLTTYEGQGFEISLAEIYRRLKKVFKK